MRFAMYRRVSTMKQADGFSLEEQASVITDLAATYGASSDDYCDIGRSGESLTERPQLAELLNRLGEYDAVLVVDESRLARNELVAATIRDHLRRSHTRLITPSGEVDLNDPTDRFTSGVVALANQLEQDLRTAKMIAGLRRTAAAGFWPGGPPPYGYQLSPSEDNHTLLELNEEEAAVLRLVADLIGDQGFTTYSAAAHLNGVGLRTRKGRPWRHPNLCWQLRRRHTTGTYIYDPKGEAIPIDIPAIFTHEQWNAIQAAIKGKPRASRRNRIYPLTGRGRVHLRCACGGNFYGYRDTSKRAKVVYECAQNDHAFAEERCPHFPRTTSAKELEEAVWEQISAVLSDPEYLTRLSRLHLAKTSSGAHQQTTGQLRRRLSDLETEENRIVRLLAERDQLNNVAAVDRALDEVAAERLTVEKELERLQHAETAGLAAESIPEAAQRLAALANARLANPTIDLMAEVFDLLQLDLTRTEGRTFEGVAQLPLPDPDTEGEVWAEAPLRRVPHRRRSDPASSGAHD